MFAIIPQSSSMIHDTGQFFLLFLCVEKHIAIHCGKDIPNSRGAPMIAKAVSFVAKSGTGKTTLLEKVIAELKSRGYRVGVIKHDAHRFDIDYPGKDSHRLTAAGADTMLITSPEKLALIKKHAESPPIEELIATYFNDVFLDQ